MRRLIWIMAAIMMLPLFPGCTGKEAERMMDEADSLIVSQPEFALAILDDIPRSGRSRGANEARYNMLRTEAAYRALDDTIIPDSAIAASVNYYTRKDDKANAARARYYLAMLKMQRKEYPAAAVDLLLAENDATNSKTSHFLRGLIYRDLGDCFDEYYDISTSITYQKRAYEEFRLDDNNIYGANALADIASRFLDLRKYDSAIYYADEAIRIDKISNDSSAIPYANLIKAKSLVKLKKAIEASDIFEKTYIHDRELLTDADYVSWGIAYLMNGKIDKAKFCSNNIKHLEKAMNSIDVNILFMEGKHKECNELLFSTFDILDSVKNTVWTRNDISVINDYYSLKQRESTSIIEKEINKRNTWIIGCLLVLMLCVAVYFIILTSLRKRLSDSMHNAQLLNDIICGRESELKYANEDISDLRKKISDLQERLKQVLNFNIEIKNNLDTSNAKLADSQKKLQNSQNELRVSNDSISDFQFQITSLRNRIEIIRKELESSQNELETSRDKLDNSLKALEEAYSNEKMQKEKFEKRYDEFKKEIHELLYARFELVSLLLAQKYDLDQNPNTVETPEKLSSQISKCIQTELEKFVNNPNLAKELEAIINRKLDNLILKLRDDFPDFNENYINLYIFSLLKFNSAAISILQNSSINTIYSRKSKLKKRIMKKDCANKDLYLRFIE